MSEHEPDAPRELSTSASPAAATSSVAEAHHSLPAGSSAAPWEAGPARSAPGTFPRAVLSVATLAVVGFSLALTTRTAFLQKDKRNEFLMSNALGAAPRKLLLLALLGGLAFPLLVCGVLWLFKRSRMARGLNTLADLLAPLCLAFAVPLLFIWQFGQQKTTYYLVLLTAFVFASRALFTRAFRTASELSRPTWLRRPKWLRLPARVHWPARLPKPRVPSAWAGVTVVLVAVAYAAYMIHYTVLRHRLIQTMAFDLGIYDNLMFNAVHGRLFHSPVLFGPGKFSYIAGHAEYVMLLFAPIYALRPKCRDAALATGHSDRRSGLPTISLRAALRGAWPGTFGVAGLPDV